MLNSFVKNMEKGKKEGGVGNVDLTYQKEGKNHAKV